MSWGKIRAYTVAIVVWGFGELNTREGMGGDRIQAGEPLTYCFTVLDRMVSAYNRGLYYTKMILANSL